MMDTLLLVLQVLLALHTLMGAVWKFANTVDAVPTLKAMGNAVWRGLGLIEVAIVAALVLPLLVDSLAVLAPIGAFAIVLEMLGFSLVHFRSGAKAHGPVVYWLVVAALAGALGVVGLG